MIYGGRFCWTAGRGNVEALEGGVDVAWHGDGDGDGPLAAVVVDGHTKVAGSSPVDFDFVLGFQGGDEVEGRSLVVELEEVVIYDKGKVEVVSGVVEKAGCVGAGCVAGRGKDRENFIMGLVEMIVAVELDVEVVDVDVEVAIG